MEYNTKKQAQRAAKDMGLAAQDVFALGGKWVVGKPDVPANENIATTDAEIDAALGEAVNLTSADVEQPSAEDGAAKLDEPFGEIEQDVSDAIAASGNADEPVVEDEQSDASTVVPTPVMPAASIVSPFAFIWAFLDLNSHLSRKAQIAVLKASGYNENTVKTQVSRYYSVGGVKAAWLAKEKIKRDAAKAEIDAMVKIIQANKAAEAQALADAAAAAAAVEQVEIPEEVKTEE